MPSDWGTHFHPAQPAEPRVRYLSKGLGAAVYVLRTRTTIRAMRRFYAALLRVHPQIATAYRQAPKPTRYFMHHAAGCRCPKAVHHKS